MSWTPAWLACSLVEVVGSALRVRGRCEYSAIVILKNFEPIRNVRGVVFPRFLVQFQVGAQESGTKFCNEFLGSVPSVAPTFASKISIKPLLVFRPVCEFMREGRVVAFSVTE